jgi:hypothetical protein
MAAWVSLASNGTIARALRNEGWLFVGFNARRGTLGQHLLPTMTNVVFRKGYMLLRQGRVVCGRGRMILEAWLLRAAVRARRSEGRQ